MPIALFYGKTAEIASSFYRHWRGQGLERLTSMVMSSDDAINDGIELVFLHDSPLGFEDMSPVCLPQVGGDDVFHLLDGLWDVENIDGRVGLAREVVMQVFTARIDGVRFAEIAISQLLGPEVFILIVL